MDVTVPMGIAPLNFCYTAEDGPVPVTTFSHGDMEVSIKGREDVWKDREWKKMLEAVKLDRTDAEKKINSTERIQFGFRMSE